MYCLGYLFENRVWYICRAGWRNLRGTKLLRSKSKKALLLLFCSCLWKCGSKPLYSVICPPVFGCLLGYQGCIIETWTCFRKGIFLPGREAQGASPGGRPAETSPFNRTSRSQRSWGWGWIEWGRNLIMQILILKLYSYVSWQAVL